MRPRPLLFLQLPQLDNDITASHENVPLASWLLVHAAARAAEPLGRRADWLTPDEERLDNRHVVGAILGRAPAVIAATLYLWNIERTLRVLRAVRARRPAVRIVVGGPEVARAHPFLFRARIADAAVAGEGEAVFPSILRAFRGAAARPDFTTVAWREPGGRYAWGRVPPPAVDLAAALPPAADALWRPDAHGVACLETSRGCPLACTYCRYPALRPRMGFLPLPDILARVRVLRRRGAREIRFVDPTFNARPDFTSLLRALARLNADHGVAFFAELQADRLTDAQAALLQRAGFTEIEVGLQSRSPAVLAAIRRTGRPDAIAARVRDLARRGIRVTLDLMYGLPVQRRADILRDLRWAARLPRVNVQCLQTLLLPGTELRRTQARWGMPPSPRPPYGVTRTDRMTPDDLRAVEHALEAHPRLRSDTPTPLFVGRRLAGLFPEAVRVPVSAGDPLPRRLPGREARRTVYLRGADLFAHRAALADLLHRAMHTEPDMLWLFVLEPQTEEPLDLLDALVAALRAEPRHLLDRYAAPLLAGRLASRRLLVRLPARRLDPGWMAAAEATLRAAFE